LGKTSAARIFLCARGDYGTLTIDGSNEDKNVRKLIETFASCVPFTPGLKICFIDEANFLLKPARAALRGAIERFSANCRFILATNDVTEIDPAVRSRLLNIHFAAPREDDQELVERIQERISARMVELGWSFDRKRLDTIILENLSDFRRMANKLEFEFPRSTERGDTE
jgi:DNA polymerase III delta prime subunit